MFGCKVYTCFSSPLLPPAHRWKTVPAQPESSFWWRPRSSQHPGALQLPQADGLGSPIHTNKDQLLFVPCLTTAAMWTGIKLTHLLHIDFDVLLEVVSIQVEYKIMDEVEAIAHNNERQLVGEFSFLSVKWWGNEKIAPDVRHRSHLCNNTVKSTKDSRWFLKFKSKLSN